MDQMKPDIAARLRALKVELQLVNNRAFGELCGANESQVNNWLTGVQRDNGSMPRVPQMALLCDATGVTLDWIYRGRLGPMDAKLASRLNKLIANAGEYHKGGVAVPT
jgi:transcriptional regulator with XRE-family HTH domain